MSPMSMAAFAPSISVTAATSFAGRGLDARRPLGGTQVKMSAADSYMFRSQTREFKQAATATGVYTVQCTEGTAGANTAEATRLAVLAKEFRLRQANVSARYADFYATRRAAIIAAAGSHINESYAVRFPARAAAGVLGRAEKKRACSRYFGKSDEQADEYMFECVERQYKAMRVAGGVYSTACADGRTAGDADTARISALATQFRAACFTDIQKTQMRYDASLEAVFSGRGCSYEEDEYMRFPKMASAIRWSTGAYAAYIGGPAASGAMAGKLATVTEQVQGVNRDAYWPSYKIRPAIGKPSKPWMPKATKSYSPMSTAALEYGIKAQSDPFVPSEYAGWSPGWTTKSSLTVGK